MAVSWKVPKTKDDRKADGGTISGDTSFDEAASSGNGNIKVTNLSSSDTLTCPGVGNLGTPDVYSGGEGRWDITQSQFEDMRDACTGSSGSAYGEVSCSTGNTSAVLYINSENHFFE